MNKKHHIFVIVATLVYIFIMKQYKKSLLQSLQENKSEPNGFIYVLYIPIVLYIAFYLHKNRFFELISSFDNVVIKNMSEDLISSAYPDSLSSI